ncbi:hypothetical protein [Aestuariirhabdus sp. LZHN29]|uniref:hypothetical protein n=1 Tax=Aestuariirhabdus sp. LZHN29 TaxID=3417462 RepID=UPI003CF3A87A
MIKLGMKWVLAAVALVLAGCGSSAKITNAWIDPQVSESSLDGVLVIAVAGEKPDSQQIRAEFENAFVKILQRKGVRAVSSYTLVPRNGTKEEVLGAARAEKLESILVVRYVGSTEEEVYHRGTSYYTVMPVYTGGYGRGFGGYYGYIFNVYSDPASWTTNTRVTLISDLYQTQTEQRVWQASSDISDIENLDGLRDSSVESFTDELLSKNLLKKP